MTQVAALRLPESTGCCKQWLASVEIKMPKHVGLGVKALLARVRYKFRQRGRSDPKGLASFIYLF